MSNNSMNGLDQNNEARKEWIDIAKGFAMLLVIFNHFWHFRIPAIIISSFHMALFMFLSGYLFKVKDNTFKQARGIVRRYGKPFLLTYFLVTIVYCIENFIKQRFPIGHFQPWKEFLYSNIQRLFFSFPVETNGIKEIGVIWYLAACIFASLVFLLIVKLFKKPTVQLIIVILYFFATEYLSQKYSLPYWIASGGNKYLFWMCCGWLYKNYEDKLSQNTYRNKTILKRIVGFLMVIIGVLYLYRIINLLMGGTATQIILRFTSIVPIMAVIWVTKSIESTVNIFTRLAKWIGRNTIYVLCVHSFGVSVVGAFWLKLGIYNADNPIMMIVRMVFTIAFAYVLKRIHVFLSSCFTEEGKKNETR